MSKKIAIIIGSSRPSRIGADISNWVLNNLPVSENIHYELVDLAEWNLPMLNETNQPSMHKYEHEHTKKWSAKIEQYDGFVFVTPEYNAGYSAVLKNAIDYLYDEWKEKPATIVSYGWSGGASANNQLQAVLNRIGFKVIEINPELSFGKDFFNESHQIKDIENALKNKEDDINRAGSELIKVLLN